MLLAQKFRSLRRQARLNLLKSKAGASQSHRDKGASPYPAWPPVSLARTVYTTTHVVGQRDNLLRRRKRDPERVLDYSPDASDWLPSGRACLFDNTVTDIEPDFDEGKRKDQEIDQATESYATMDDVSIETIQTNQIPSKNLDSQTEIHSSQENSSPKDRRGQEFYCTDYPPCKLSFTRSDLLANHIRDHTGERPYQCYCGRRFSRLDSLRQHAQAIHAIPADSLAAIGTRFERQIRTDRVGRSGRPEPVGRLKKYTWLKFL